MPNRSTVALVLLACMAVIAVSLAVTRDDGGTASATEPSTGSIRFTPDKDDRVRVAVFGDSISQGDSPAFSRGDTGKTSWVHHLDKQAVRFVGGYAKGGLTSKELLSTTSEGLRSDIVVYELGTNDILHDTWTAADQLKNLDKHSSQINAPENSARILVMGIGPVPSETPERIQTWNDDLRAGAQQRGWTYVDPWTKIRTDDYVWRDKDDTADGKHPAAGGAKKLGKAMTPAIVKAYAEHPEE